MSSASIVVTTEEELRRLMAQAVCDGIRRALKDTRLPDNTTRMQEMEAAGYIGVKPATLRTWRSRGKGPRFVKIGRGVWYMRRDLDAFIAAQSSSPSFFVE